MYFTSFYVVSLDTPLWISGLIPTGLGGKILVSSKAFNLQQEVIYYLEECELTTLV